MERLGFSIATKPHEILLHAVSLGEVRAMTPLVMEILKTHPDQRILITTTTLTGRAQIQKSFGDRVTFAFLPHDIGFFTKRFLKKVNPKVLMIMETEIWPNLFNVCQSLNIPTYIISACLSERSLKGYLKIPKTIQQLLSHVHILAQTEEDQKRFLTIGAKNVMVMGDLKFFISLPNDFSDVVSTLTNAKGQHFLWCLASSHEGEEKLILEAFMKLKENHPQLKLAIAPRHPERFERVESLILSYALNYQKRSHTDFSEFSLDNHDVWLFDSIGELLYLYGVSDIITVGGSFIPIGGHNLLEPAYLQKVITTGPYIDNITDTVALFEERKAIILLTEDNLSDHLSTLIRDQNLRKQMQNSAYECVINNQKALPYVMKTLNQCLKE